jgi:hypothetical protein
MCIRRSSVVPSEPVAGINKGNRQPEKGDAADDEDKVEHFAISPIKTSMGTWHLPPYCASMSTTTAL